MIGALFGCKVFINPLLDNVPRMTLSPNVSVTTEFRAEMNAWMLEFFGTENQMLSAEGSYFVGPQGLETLKKSLKSRTRSPWEESR